MKPSNPNPTLLRFLIELRKRLIFSALIVVSLFISLAYFSNPLYHCLALPLIKNLPQGSGLIATQIISPFWVPFKFSMVVAVVLALPFLLYQLWAFIAPALYHRERRLLWPLLFVSTFLFYAGMAFAYFVIFPVLFGYITKSAPENVLVMPDISQYLDFTLRMLFVFGGIFEVPVITLVLILTGVTSRAQLSLWRPYIIVGAFIVGMLLAPPDVFSQTLLAIPLWFLFELGLFCSRFIENK